MDTSEYDQIPYEGSCIPTASPERLAMLARLAGFAAPGLDNPRVLEIGCGDGGNLLPLAFYHPGWKIVGIDPSKVAIDKAEQARQLLGLENLSFEMMDVRELEPGEGFDFVLCHGVYSWVAADVREAIFDRGASVLSPQGLFYLSYNTQPGWGMRGLVRDRLRATHTGSSLKDSAQRAKKTLDQLESLLGEAEGHPYIDLLKRELDFANNRPLYHLTHEYLTEHNRAFWFGEVHGAAAVRGLHYVGDAQRFNTEGFVSIEQRAAAEAMFATDVEREESLDLVRYRQLRASVFSRSPAVEDVDPARVLSGSTLVSALRYSGEDMDFTRGEAENFICPVTQREIPVDTSLGKAALLLLAARYPCGMRLEDLLRAVSELLEHEGQDPKVTQQDIDDFLQGMNVLHEHALVQVRPSESRPAVESSSSLPTLHALARYEARQRAYLSSPWHDLLPIDAVDRVLLEHLDGCHDRGELLAIAAQAGSSNAAQQLDKLCAIVMLWGLQDG